MSEESYSNLDKLDRLRFQLQDSIVYEDPKDPKYTEVHSSTPPYKYWCEEAKLTAFYEERLRVLKEMNLGVG